MILMLYYLGLSHISSNCIQAGLLRILSYFPRLPRSATALLTFLAPPGFVFQLFGSILRSPGFFARFTKKAKVGAIGLEQSCKSPSFAKRRKDGCVSEGWPIETQACVV